MKTYAVLFDVKPQVDGSQVPQLIQADGTWEDLSPDEMVQVVDGYGSVFHSILRYAAKSYSIDEAAAIAEKYGGEVVEVVEISPHADLRVIAAKEFGRAGGKSKSAAKTSAARNNGKKGGR